MIFRISLTLRTIGLVMCLGVLISGYGFCQEINLDKMKKAGDVVCYPSLKDPAVWYYLPDQPRLAMKDGKPQFSFMKYARTSETGKAGTHTAEGGGIVHFLVTYGTGKDRVQEAERRLQEEYPDARIEGPIVYRKGSFALITSFKEGQENLVRTVAVGKAPLMEGQKAAVSMALSRQGAELLWESFKSDTPDISLVFDMEFAGIREPYEATIEADWSRVSKHKRLKAGFKYSWFGADVDMLFQELRQDGAIKITTKGENASMDKIIQSANAKLLQVMFDPAPVDDLTRAAAEKDSYSSLNQAMKMLKDSQRSSGSSSRRSSLDLKSPGFRQMMAAVINCIIPEAHASAGASVGSSSADTSGNTSVDNGQQDDNQKPFETQVQPNGGSRELTPDQREMLRELFREGTQLKDSGDYLGALEKYQEVLQIHQEITGRPMRSANTLYNIGHCMMNLGRYAQAAESFNQAADIFGRDSSDGRHCLERAREARMRAEGESGGEGQPGSGTTQDTARDTAQTGTDTPREDRARPPQDTYEREADRVADRVMPASASEDYNRARRLDNTARQNGYQQADVEAAIQAYESYMANHSAQGQRKSEIEGRLRSLRRRLPALETTRADREEVQKILDSVPGSSSSGSSASGGSSPSTSSSGTSGQGSGSSKSSGSSAGTSSTSGAVSSRPSASSGSAASSASSRPSSSRTSAAAQRAAEQKPGFSLVASFQLKNIKRSGKMVYQMNHFRSEKQSFTMAENIGSLYARYGNDSRIFRAVTIDDPVFKQREILVTLDGQDASTFTKYLNFVTVKMKKQHQSGDVTSDEIVITPEAFNSSGNSFSLNYGYKGDTNRSRWLDYQYQVTWSFHGGLEIRTPWKPENSPMLALTPPHRYRGVTIEGEGGELDDARVRHAVITVSSIIDGKTLLTQATIKNQGPAPSIHLDIPVDAGNENADVSIKWFLKGGKQVSSPARKIEGDIIYWDELP